MRDFMAMDAAARGAFLRRWRSGEMMTANISEKPEGAVVLHPFVHRTSPHGQPLVGACGACGKDGITLDMLTTDACSSPCSSPRFLINEQAVLQAIDQTSASTVEKPDDAER